MLFSILSFFLFWRKTPAIEFNDQSRSTFYAYLDLTQNYARDQRSFSSQRMLWCETDRVVRSGILEKMTPMEIAEQECKFEIMSSEVSYLKSLNIFITLFVESSELRDIINIEDWRCLFGNILEIRRASEIFLYDLAGVWEKDFMLTDIFSVIKKHSSETLKVYIEYCNNTLGSNETLKRLMLDTESFLPVLTQLQNLSACQGYTLHAFLMLPVQRVTRYPLLLQAIWIKLTPDSDEWSNCNTALSAVSQLAHECNEKVRNN